MPASSIPASTRMRGASSVRSAGSRPSDCSLGVAGMGGGVSECRGLVVKGRAFEILWV